jgi:hypothetical protein
VIYGCILLLTIVFMPGGIGGKIDDVRARRRVPSHAAL